MLKGRAFKFGDNIDTDAIIPARYLNSSDPDHLRNHCMEDADPDFAASVRPGDFIVAGKNFGCGSSREHAPISIKATGVSCVIAESFARIFYRNSMNIGLPVLECLTSSISPGDVLEVDIEAGTIKNMTRGEHYQAKPYPEFMRDLMKAGGLIPYVRERLARQARP